MSDEEDCADVGVSFVSVKEILENEADIVEEEIPCKFIYRPHIVCNQFFPIHKTPIPSRLSSGQRHHCKAKSVIPCIGMVSLRLEICPDLGFAFWGYD